MQWIHWPGSKKNEAKKVFNDINLNEYDVLCDVFGGSGWLSIRAKQINPNIKVIFNDLDQDLHDQINGILDGTIISEVGKIIDQYPEYKTDIV